MLTGMCNQEMFKSFKNIFGFAATHTHWPSPANVAVREVGFDVACTCQHGKFSKKNLKEAIARNGKCNQAMACSSSVTKIKRFVKIIEATLHCCLYVSKCQLNSRLRIL